MLLMELEFDHFMHRNALILVFNFLEKFLSVPLFLCLKREKDVYLHYQEYGV